MTCHTRRLLAGKYRILLSTVQPLCPSLDFQFAIIGSVPGCSNVEIVAAPKKSPVLGKLEATVHRRQTSLAVRDSVVFVPSISKYVHQVLQGTTTYDRPTSSISNNT